MRLDTQSSNTFVIIMITIITKIKDWTFGSVPLLLKISMKNYYYYSEVLVDKFRNVVKLGIVQMMRACAYGR